MVLTKRAEEHKEERGTKSNIYTRVCASLAKMSCRICSSTRPWPCDLVSLAREVVHASKALKCGNETGLGSEPVDLAEVDVSGE